MIVLPRPTQLSGELKDHEGAVNRLMVVLPRPTQLTGELDDHEEVVNGLIIVLPRPKPKIRDKSICRNFGKGVTARTPYSGERGWKGV